MALRGSNLTCNLQEFEICKLVQAEIAYWAPQSTISRMAHRNLQLAGTSDESTIDGWAHEISMALRQLGPNAKPSRTRFVMEVVSAPGSSPFDKS